MDAKLIIGGRAFRWGARLFCAGCCGVVSWACGTAADPEQMPEIPAADAEAWDARIEIGRPGHRIEIRAAYSREYSEAQQVRAEGGVEVVFREDEVTSTLTAERLVLEHKRDRFGMAGGVVLRAGDSLEVQADTLVWEGKEERLRIPGTLRVELVQGWERGRNLISNFAVDEWTMERVEGHWRGHGGKRVVVRAQRETSRWVAGERQVVYDSVAVEYDGMRLLGPRAMFRPEANHFSFVAGINGSDSLFQFSAARADVDMEAERMVARGAVRYSEKDAVLSAEVVEEDRRLSMLQAKGAPATYIQGARYIEARELDYRRDERLLTARGAVVFREQDRQLTAAELRYERDTGEISAWYRVVLQAPELQGRLTGDSLFFALEPEAGWMSGAPLLRRIGDDGDTLTIAATVLYFDLARRELSGKGNFALQTTGVKLNAERGAYNTDAAQVIVAGGVVLGQQGGERDYSSRLQADSMLVELVDRRVERIAVPGRVFVRIEANGRHNWIEGQGGRVFMAAGDLQRIEVDADADVTHRHPQKDEVSRFHGKKMTLYFDAEGLRRALVSGAAKLVTRLQDEGGEVAVNEVGGEELEIHFADGSISEVRIGPDIEGSYYPPEEP